jgi:hypothetical protein
LRLYNPPQQNDPRATISNCRVSSNPTHDGIKEVCDWEILEFQLEKDMVNPGNITNVITLVTTDTFGNIDIQDITVNVDLFAVTLGLDTDIEYFSPNGDGRQDGVEFINLASNAVIDTWELEVRRISDLQVEKEFTGSGSLPPNIPWNGKKESGEWVSDGAYEYILSITTTDGLIFSTIPDGITAVTDLTDQVIITYPGNDSFTTRGVTTVQGQGPRNTTVRICSDIIALGTATTCDTEAYAQVDNNGSFSVIFPIYRIPEQSITEHYLTATASDKYGNIALNSNTVKMSVTTKDPFVSISALPAFTGVNNEADYQNIINKLNNNEEITQADIDALRSVVLRSTVNQGTERVVLGFADRTNLSELPAGLEFNNLGYIDDDSQTKLYENFVDGTNTYNNCSSVTCTWDFYYPIPPIGGGLYEIAFNGKIGSTVQVLSTALTIDGNIPAAPIILDVDKIISGASVNTNIFDSTFYSNSEILSLKGVSDANATISVTDQNGNVICSTTSSQIGFWNCLIDTATIPTYSNPNTNTYNINLNVSATLGANTTISLSPVSVVIDKIKPTIDNLITTNQWHQSGDVVDVSLTADELLWFAKNTDIDPYGAYGISPDITRECINSRATYTIPIINLTLPIQLGKIDDLNIQNPQNTALGSFTLSGNVVEGKYCSTIQVADRAGNTQWKEFTIFIDNTIPDRPIINTAEWAKFNGIYTRSTFVAEGRTVPEYSHEEKGVTINGLAEKDMKVQLYVDGSIRQEALASDSSVCKTSLDSSSQPMIEDNMKDNVLVENMQQCKYQFYFEWDRGERGYFFQIKVIDKALNESILSEDELIYYDKTLPRKPETYTSKSPSYSPTPNSTGENFNAKNMNALTKDKEITITTFGEAYADAEAWITAKPKVTNINEQYQFIRNPGVGFLDQRFELGGQTDEREGCVELVNGRRTGICEDGNYTMSFKHTDAAGNGGEVLNNFVVERDTVRPEKAGVSIYRNGNTIRARVSGEIGARVYANGKALSSKTQGREPIDIFIAVGTCGRTYKFNITLKDNALNESEAISQSIEIPACVSNYNSKVIGDQEDQALWGDKDDPYAGSDFSSLGELYIEYNYEYNWNATEMVKTVKSSNVPAPRITYIEVDDTETVVDVYGIAIPKNAKIKIKMNYVVESTYSCWVIFTCKGYDWKYKEELVSAEHAGIGLFKDGREYNFSWNIDQTTGRWHIQTGIQSNGLAINDEIYAKTKLYNGFNIDLEQHGNTSFGYSPNDWWAGIESGESNRVKIRHSKAWYKTHITGDFGVDIVDGTALWSYIELTWIYELLSEIQQKFYDHNFLMRIIRNADNPNICALARNFGDTGELVVQHSFISSTCDSSYGVSLGKDEFKVVIFHEIAHSFANENPNLELLFKDISWKDSGRTNICFNTTCNIFIWKETGDTLPGGIVLERDQDLGLDFVNDYAGQPFPDTFGNPRYNSFKEDWAESVAFFRYIRGRYTDSNPDSLLRNKEQYLLNNIFND